MVDLPFLDSATIERSVTMAAAIQALIEAFARGPHHLERSAYDAAGGDLLVMPAVDQLAAGVKLLMVQPDNASRDEPVIQGIYVLFDASRGRPIALLDGAALTRLRTPAASAIATAALARHDATTLGIIGSGPQAAAHVEAMFSVRPNLRSVVIANRSPLGAQRVLDEVADRDHHFVIGLVGEAAACDIVCVATRSTEPLIDRAMVRPGAHLNAVGSYRPDMREVAGDLLAASIVTVDDVAAARAEAGDLIAAVAEGSWSWDHVAGDLTALAANVVTRPSPDAITLFKGVGLAFEDLVVARLVATNLGLL